MNRLSSLIVRRVGPFASADAYASMPEQESAFASGLLDDLKLFGIAWLGGLVFFGTLFG